jgi:quercetin dioxygenase-like cupin family protein
MGVHDDQEAIYILEGTGTASVGGEQFAVAPGTAFFVGPTVPHTIKRDRAGGPVKVLWTHGAI